MSRRTPMPLLFTHAIYNPRQVPIWTANKEYQFVLFPVLKQYSYLCTSVFPSLALCHLLPRARFNTRTSLSWTSACLPVAPPMTSSAVWRSWTGSWVLGRSCGGKAQGMIFFCFHVRQPLACSRDATYFAEINGKSRREQHWEPLFFCFFLCSEWFSHDVDRRCRRGCFT